MIYLKSNSKEFHDFIEHLAELGHNGFDAMLGSMHEVAEEGLWTLHDEAAKRTQEHSGRLLDSFTLGNKLCVYDVGETDIVFGSALYYAQMVDAGHAIVPPGYKKDYRRQKRRKKENQRYDYFEGAHFFNPALRKIEKDFIDRMSYDLNLIVKDTSFIKKKMKRKRPKGAIKP
ncbi:MAG TPA: hypothetical protein VK190_04400 [Pseudoneobacillus sp.]|nr:hypothetical protein [Pseudoneobacillus sp.]